MSCVFEDSAIDFDCLKKIVSSVYSGNIDVYLVRMIIKQLDAGLSMFGLPSTTQSVDYNEPSDVARELESLLPTDDVMASVNYVQIVLLLLQLLKMIQK